MVDGYSTPYYSPDIYIRINPAMKTDFMTGVMSDAHVDCRVHFHCPEPYPEDLL